MNLEGGKSDSLNEQTSLMYRLPQILDSLKKFPSFFRMSSLIVEYDENSIKWGNYHRYDAFSLPWFHRRACCLL